MEALPPPLPTRIPQAAWGPPTAAATTTSCPHCSIPARLTVIKLSDAIHNAATSSKSRRGR